MIYASYSKLSKELKNSIEISVGEVVLELLIKTIFWLILIRNLKAAGRTEISIPSFNSLDNLL